MKRPVFDKKINGTRAVNFSKIDFQTLFQNDTLSTVPASPVHTTFQPSSSKFKQKIQEQ
jgi:hypothetical protein